MAFRTSNSSLTNDTIIQQNCNFKLNMPLDVQIIGTSLYSMIFIIGVIGNLCVIYVLVKEKRLRNFTNYLLANLSIADLTVLIACIPSGKFNFLLKF
jgi:hypothetical protein